LLHGRIFGLEPGDAEHVELLASAPNRQDQHGRVEADCTYHVEDLAPGPRRGLPRGGQESANVGEQPECRPSEMKYSPDSPQETVERDEVLCHAVQLRKGGRQALPPDLRATARAEVRLTTG